MLDTNAENRPSINQVCSFSLIKSMISEVLDAQTFKDEFAHTILHKRDIFKEMKTSKKKKGGILPDEDIEKIKSKAYEPDGRGTGVDKTAFDTLFGQYVDHIGNSKGKPGDARNPHTSLVDSLDASESTAETVKEQDEDMTDT